MKADEQTSTSTEAPEILEIRNLTVHFYQRQRIIGRKLTVHAVDDVNLTLREGEILSLVGESGSGKTTLARTIVKLNRPSAGSILFKRHDIFKQNRLETREFRKRVQMIFQDPYESLNPQANVYSIVLEPLVIHKLVPRDKRDRVKTVSRVLRLVGLDPNTKMEKFPHELSGGERQRVAIASALTLEPQLLMADEPVSMLDVSVRLGILNLMLELKRELRLTYMFITHDLGVARYVGTRIAVMYFGKIVEVAESDELISHPRHHYTVLLLSSIPGSEEISHASEKFEAEYTVEPTNPPVGCRFHPRCPYAQERCRVEEPKLVEMRDGHWAACHFPAAN